MESGSRRRPRKPRMGAGATNSGDQGLLREIVALSPGQRNNFGNSRLFSGDCCTENRAAQHIPETRGNFGKLLRWRLWSQTLATLAGPTTFHMTIRRWRGPRLIRRWRDPRGAYDTGGAHHVPYDVGGVPPDPYDHMALAGSLTSHMTLAEFLAAHTARRILWDRMFYGLFQARKRPILWDPSRFSVQALTRWAMASRASL